MANRRVIFLAPETSRDAAQALYAAATLGTVAQPAYETADGVPWFGFNAASVGDARIAVLNNGVGSVPDARLYIVGRTAPDTGKLLETNSDTAQDKIGTAFTFDDGLADNGLQLIAAALQAS